MRTITEFNKRLQIWTTNTEYEKIYNCRVIDPTYEKGKWLHNAEFFLDKRYWMEEFVSWEYHYTDDIEIYANKYYLYHDNSEMFVWVKDGETIKKIAGPFNYNESNPIRFSEWRWAMWTKKESSLTITNWTELSNNNLILNEDLVYEDGYIILDVGTGHDIEVWDYVLFKDNIYAWATIRVDLYDAGKIYVLWINTKGSIPTNGDTIDIYSDTGNIPLIGTEDGVMAIHTNGTELASHTNILPGDITDVVKFNEDVFVLKNEVVYYSTKTFDDNLQFYKATDRKRIKGAYKLISKGKFLIVMGDENRLVSSIAETSNSSGGYVFYPLNYHSDLYSKYSYVFTDSTLYIVQSDKQIAKIDISSLNATAFNLDSTPIVDTVRWLLDDMDDYNSSDKWEMYINDNRDDRRIHFLYVKNSWGTIEYEYDKHYQHWLLHTYTRNIYKISDQFLMEGHVSNIWGYNDLWDEYEQSVNFTIQTPNLITQVWLIRMIMGISNDFPMRFNVDIDVESSHSVTKRKIKIDSMTFDTMPVDHSLEMLNVLSNWKDNKHDGSIASVQRTIMMSGRYHRYNINSYERFIYGYSYVLWSPSNIFVNERNFSF